MATTVKQFLEMLAEAGAQDNDEIEFQVSRTGLFTRFAAKSRRSLSMSSATGHRIIITEYRP